MDEKGNWLDNPKWLYWYDEKLQLSMPEGTLKWFSNSIKFFKPFFKYHVLELIFG